MGPRIYPNLMIPGPKLLYMYVCNMYIFRGVYIHICIYTHRYKNSTWVLYVYTYVHVYICL